MYVMYRKDTPTKGIHVFKTEEAAAKQLKLADGPVVLTPVDGIEDLKGVPLSVLKMMYRERRPGVAVPHDRAKAAQELFPELVRARAGRGIGVRARSLLLEGKGTQEVLDAIHGEFPLSRATAKDVSIYRSQLRKEGLLSVN